MNEGLRLVPRYSDQFDVPGARVAPMPYCSTPDACGWPGICRDGRCIAEESADSPNRDRFARPHPLREQFRLQRAARSFGGHMPAALAMLGWIDGWAERINLPPRWARAIDLAAKVIGLPLIGLIVGYALALWVVGG